MLFLVLASPLALAADWTPESNKVVYTSRTTNMQASPEQCMAVATNFEEWKNWTAWTAERDPEAVWTYVDVDGMVGDEMSWDGPVLDSGRTVITGYTAPSADAAGVMDFTTYFGKKQTPSMGRITCAEANSGTQATWEFQMKAGLMTRLFRKSIEKAIGGDFEVGLAGLKAEAEGGTTPASAPAPVAPAADEAVPTDESAQKAETSDTPVDPPSEPADEPAPSPPIADPPTNPAPGQPVGQPLP